MNKKQQGLVWVMAGLLVLSSLVSGCKAEEKPKKAPLTVFLWDNALIRNLAPYIREQLPDKDIEFIPGNNDTDLYAYFDAHGQLPDLFTVRRWSGRDAKVLRPHLLDFSSYDIVSKYSSYALQYYYRDDGSIYWLPICGIPQTMFANKTLFDQYGIKLPTNYQEYRTACQRFHELGIIPYSMDLGEDWSRQEVIQAGAIGEFTSLNGIEWRGDAEGVKGAIPFDDELWSRIFAETNTFLKDSCFTADDLRRDVTTGSDLFLEGKAAMFHGTPEILRNIQMQKDAQLVRLPSFSQTSDEAFIYMTPSLNVACNKRLEDDKEKLETALQVIDCMVSEKGQQLIADGSAVISLNPGVPSLTKDMKGLAREMKNNNFYFRYAAQRSFLASSEAIHGLLSGEMDERQAYETFREIMNREDEGEKEAAFVTLEKEYPIFLNERGEREAASSILTTVRNDVSTDLAFVPSYYFTASLFPGECSQKQLKLMIAIDSDTPLFVEKLEGAKVFELVSRYLARTDGDFQVATKYELPIASGMTLKVRKAPGGGFELQDILVQGASLDMEKTYSVLLTNGTMSVLEKMCPETEFEPVPGMSLGGAWMHDMSQGTQPANPEAYMQIGK